MTPAAYNWDRQRYSLVIPDARPQDAITMSGFGVGSFMFRAVITADDIEPIAGCIKVTTDPQGMTVERSEAPEPSQVYSVGI